MRAIDVVTRPQPLFMGSFTPRRCGIATFTRDLVSAYNVRFRGEHDVVAIDEPGGESRSYPAAVVGRLSQNDRSSYGAITKMINAHAADVLNIQFEYGLFGGAGGEWSLDLVSGIAKPIILTLHTVLPSPGSEHARLAAALCSAADRVVVLSQAGVELLAAVYGVPPEKVRLLHHGVPDVPFTSGVHAKARLGLASRKVISTFGLISGGKGLEHAIAAMRHVVRRVPEALYLVIGETHPIVREREGEAYRHYLHALVKRFGLQAHVHFIDAYQTMSELSAYLEATDVYVTPYENQGQAVSGTLAYAMGFGKAIVSTPYLYAKEMLADGRGLIVPSGHPRKMADAIVELLENPGTALAMQRRAYQFSRQMTWRCVAEGYGQLFDRALVR
jgi:glycosyltransferase involved in cell wall biosynthesis